MENQDFESKKTRKRKTQEERLQELQIKKQKLLAQETKLRQSTANAQRKRRLNTFYTFGGEIFSNNWEELRKILIEENTWHSIEVVINGEIFASKNKFTD